MKYALTIFYIDNHKKSTQVTRFFEEIPQAVRAKNSLKNRLNLLDSLFIGSIIEPRDEFLEKDGDLDEPRRKKFQN